MKASFIKRLGLALLLSAITIINALRFALGVSRITLKVTLVSHAGRLRRIKIKWI